MSPLPIHFFLKAFVVSILIFVPTSGFSPCQQPRLPVSTQYTRMYAKKQSRVSGVGGMPGLKTSGSKQKTGKASNIKNKPTKNGTTKSVFDRPKLSNETPWASILVAFLNPLRNPNSLFLYLLLIVSVLGKLNENNVGPN